MFGGNLESVTETEVASPIGKHFGGHYDEWSTSIDVALASRLVHFRFPPVALTCNNICRKLEWKLCVNRVLASAKEKCSCHEDLPSGLESWSPVFPPLSSGRAGAGDGYGGVGRRWRCFVGRGLPFSSGPERFDPHATLGFDSGWFFRRFFCLTVHFPPMIGFGSSSSGAKNSAPCMTPLEPPTSGASLEGLNPSGRRCLSNGQLHRAPRALSRCGLFAPLTEEPSKHTGRAIPRSAPPPGLPKSQPAGNVCAVGTPFGECTLVTSRCIAEPPEPPTSVSPRWMICRLAYPNHFHTWREGSDRALLGWNFVMTLDATTSSGVRSENNTRYPI